MAGVWVFFLKEVIGIISAAVSSFDGGIDLRVVRVESSVSLTAAGVERIERSDFASAS